jgi:hypothetical protein
LAILYLRATEGAGYDQTERNSAAEKLHAGSWNRA